MEITKVIGGSPTTIKGLLVGGSGKCFIIPPFQRNYSWEIKQCKELYEDLVLSAMNKKPHYLGNIITYSGKNNYSSYVERILVDGQQRITTILLLFCAIKDVISDKEIKDDLLNNYLQNVGKNDKRVRLKQVVGDIEVFEQIINNNIDSLDEKQKGNKLVINYNIFVSFLKKEKRVDIIKELLVAIVNTEIMDIVLIDENNLNAVQVIFEKINSTGKPLTSGDLIRNYLLFANSSDEQEKLYEQYWSPIEKNIKDITKFSKVHYILDTLEYFDENDIYSTFKEYYDSANTDHKEILNDMKKNHSILA